MTLRPLLFWPHLVAGVLAGAIVLIMSVTGVLLTYEKQMIAWADRRPAALVDDRQRLPPEELLTRIEAEAGAMPASVVVSSVAGQPILASVRQRMVLVDPYSGALIGESAPRLRRFFRVVTDWHRWLAASTENRAGGRAITGWANTLFLFLILTGMYLWIPRRWTWRHVRAVAWFSGRLSGKARDFNWHNVIGIWCAIPLVLIVASAMPISFPWANALVYRAVGEAPPAAGGRGGERARGGRADEARGGQVPGQDGRASHDAPRGQTALAGLNAAWGLAQSRMPGWRTITIRPPSAADEPITFTIDRGSGGQPQHRGTLTVSREAAAEPRWEPFASQSRSRRLRSISRFLHTGEVLGLAGQTIAGLATLGSVVLVWTGIALAWRRFFSRARVIRQDERSAA